MKKSVAMFLGFLLSTIPLIAMADGPRFPTGAMTLEGWFKFSDVVDQDTPLFEYTNGNEGWEFALIYDESNSTDVLRFYQFEAASQYTVEVNWLPDTNTWYHLAMTFDPSNSNAVTFYVDGVQQGDTQHIDLNSVIDPNVPLTVTPNARAALLRIWNSSLSQSIVDSNKCTVLGAENNLDAEWTFDNNLLDDAGHNNTLINSAASFVSDVPACLSQTNAIDATEGETFQTVALSSGLLTLLSTLNTRLTLDATQLTANHSQYFPDKDGTFAMLSDIPSPNIDLTTATGILAGSHGGTGWGSILSGFIPFGNGTGPLATSTNLYWDSTNSRLGVATTSPSNTFEVNGTAAALHVRGVGSTPGIATGSGLGTGGSASIKGSDIAGEITAISGLLPMGGSTLVTVTFSSAYPTAPYVVLTPANAATALLSGLTAVYVTDTTTTFVITSGATGLGGSATYKWNYLVVE